MDERGWERTSKNNECKGHTRGTRGLITGGTSDGHQILLHNSAPRHPPTNRGWHMRPGTFTKLSRVAAIIPFADRSDGQNSSGVYAGTDEKGCGESNPRAIAERLRPPA
ncbi:hypothetical protein HN011_010062 [Eciton burchellii]|nr:hypothetical protein HN011_010062 [Eciton burchellii]